MKLWSLAPMNAQSPETASADVCGLKGSVDLRHFATNQYPTSLIQAQPEVGK